ncbi:MAG: trypsin-like peptidase domain-containing protein [Actinobacteria bacterium]|nr:trypsin-like peptidase domain-containing protein [Actinomycetota bacterium]
MKRTLLKILASAAAVVIAAGTGAAGYAAFATEPEAAVGQVVTAGEPAARSTGLTVPDVYDRTHAGVVEITVTMSASASDPFGPGGGEQQAQGSGFVYDKEGHVVTNQHVVAGAETASVTFSNGETYDATVVGTDPSTDLAVLKVDAPASLLTPLELGSSSELEVGDGVVAIGSPFGLEETLTAGIVSALGRQMEAPNGFTINDSIQTDAAINHGNSGGPLLNMQGEVVGVNAQISSESGGNDGVGFAIPSDTVEPIVAQLLSDGAVEHAYLGVGVATIDDSVASELDVPVGVALTEVRSGTPAAEAGLRAGTGTTTVEGREYPTGGDVITEVDGKPVGSAEELQRAIDAKQPGDTIALTYSRDGESHTVEVELETRPS